MTPADMPELPPLPEPGYGFRQPVKFTADQMRAYARDYGAALCRRTRDTAPDLAEVAHALEVAVRFAKAGLPPPVEEAAEWSEIIARCRAPFAAVGQDAAHLADELRKIAQGLHPLDKQRPTLFAAADALVKGASHG